MGRTYLFECAKCGYRAKISGGPDRGCHFAVQTILCHECKALYDAVTAMKIAARSPLGGRGTSQLARNLSIGSNKTPFVAPLFASVLNRLPPGGGKRSRWINFKTVCPVAPGHRVRPWNRPDKCPKCGVFLEQNALPYRIWD